ncbi:MAG TPA: hypothetical protein VGL73_01430 [Caulobacteraceae bacterium]
MPPDPDCTSRRRRLFLVEAADEIDVLLRLLGPFAVQHIRVLGVALSSSPDGLTVRLETGPMPDGQARGLAEKLATLPVVRRVGSGWLSAVPADPRRGEWPY